MNRSVVSRLVFAALLIIAGSSCADSGDKAATCTVSVGESLTSAGEVACDTLLDCPDAGIKCVQGICDPSGATEENAGTCKYVNLALPDVQLPADPMTGDLIGEECKPAPPPSDWRACTIQNDCDDGNPCTVDECTALGCAYSVIPDGSQCSYTPFRVCIDGAC